MKCVFESFSYETFNKCKQGSEILASRSISRTQVNIYDGVFFTEIVNGMKAVNVSQKSSIVDIPQSGGIKFEDSWRNHGGLFWINKIFQNGQLC